MPKSFVHIALFFVSLIYASNFTIAKEVMPEYLTAMAFLSVRVLVATTLFWLFAFVQRNTVQIERSDFKKLAICAFFGVGLNMICYFKGLSLTNPINASIIMAVNPIVVMLAAYFLLGERLKRIGVIGLIIAGIGTVILIGWNGIDFSSDYFVGDILVLINAIAFALYLVLVSPLLSKYPTIEVIKWMFLMGTIFILPFGITDLLAADWSAIPSDIWMAIAYVAVMTTFVVYMLNAWAISQVGSTVVGSYIYLQPILAIMIAVAFGKDVFTLPKAVLMLLIFTGVYLVGRGRT